MYGRELTLDGLSRKSAGCLTGLLFRAQPIVRTHNREIFGYELLYRAQHPNDWSAVDSSLLRYLAEHEVAVPVFVNLSNDLLRNLDEGLVVAAHMRNDVYFEWSEIMCDEAAFQTTVAQIERLVQRGVRLVIDDFGSGRDGFQRIASVPQLFAAKIDGAFFHKSRRSPKLVVDGVRFP
jgi:EAL domain-containing protein (putative c-di-GMP-specific phosphodiesterase class I)